MWQMIGVLAELMLSHRIKYPLRDATEPPPDFTKRPLSEVARPFMGSGGEGQ
jgi:hypothetical protein